MTLFRERLLGSLLDKRALSQELVHKLLAWRHPGFSAHVGEPIMASDKQRLGDTAAYLYGEYSRHVRATLADAAVRKEWTNPGWRSRRN
jgi:hypothetical protein